MVTFQFLNSWNGFPFGVFVKADEDTLSFVFRFGDESVSVGFEAFFAGRGWDEKKNEGSWCILGARGMDTQWFSYENIVRVVNALEMTKDWKVSVCVSDDEPMKLVFWVVEHMRCDFFFPPLVT